MKILHTADWHIGQFKGPVVDGVNLRSQDTVKCLEYMVQVAIEEKPDIVCVSGDIFHQEQVGPVRYSDEMITATNIITSLAHFSKYVIVMRGTPNHDGAAQFRVLERMLLNIRNVDVVTEPGVIKTPWADIACLPGFDKQEFRAKFPGLSADEENLAWTKYISEMVFALRAECEKTPILMAHYTVPGCNMESGQTSFFTNFEPVIPREALMAARYEAVLLGHIHRPQIIEGLATHTYPPQISEIREKCAEYTVPHLKDQGEAWGEVQKAISQYGYYRQEEALESLTPIVREAVKRLGFREICLDENQDAVRAHFFKIYSTLIERKTNDAKLPPSILEAKNKYIAQLTTHENAAIEQQHRDQIAEEPERATPEYIDMLMREHGFKR